jgi:uncharacterized coiled-coil DUF342 family protein
MNTILALVRAIVVGLVVWLLWHRQRARNAVAQRDGILNELREIESKRQSLINEAGQGGVTISTDKALKHVEELRDSYLSSGNDAAARDVDRVIIKFREENGPAIPIERAYALMKELEAKHGQS